MYRNLSKSLEIWKDKEEHLPLLIRGARQVGKTFLIEEFGKTHFEEVCTFNFEQTPSLARCFADLDPKKIINTLRLTTQCKIIPGKTLLFLDEIQECPQAILSLRYFKEQLPLLHVIGAGSLLEFAMRDEAFRMPVGRVQFYYLRPLSFQEFLKARGEQNLVEAIQNATPKDPLPLPVHEHLLTRVKEYSLLGGMPAVLKKYLETGNLQECQQVQQLLIQGYQRDFGKYAKATNHKLLQKVFDKAPGMIGEIIKYSRIDQTVRSRDLKTAIELLTLAGLICPITATNASGLPLNSLMDEKKFKLLYLDVGLVNSLSHLEPETLLAPDLLTVNRGSLAEQLVGQELLASQEDYLPGELYFWHRAGSSIAEVDYILAINGKILPIEVKAGKTGRLKSMHLFLQEKKASLGIRFSQLPLQQENKLLTLPLYMVGELRRLVAGLGY